MLKKTTKKIEYGDWQTPIDLARNICNVVSKRICPEYVIEPNCGKGSFLRASIEFFPAAKRYFGLDINIDYVSTVKTIKNESLEVICGDFFTFDWYHYIKKLSGPILIIGNPPWVTNAELMRIGSSNIPRKVNINNVAGIYAITGKSNFDISEWMLIKEIEMLQGRDAFLAMLCKTSTARKAITYAWKNSFLFTQAELRIIDAKKYFGVAVDACLLVIRFHPKSDQNNHPCYVYDSLVSDKHTHVIGMHNGMLVSNINIIDKYSELINGNNDHFCWRSGIKHDCSLIMELRLNEEGKLVNGCNERVDIEEDLIYPLLKSSDLGNNNIKSIKRYMLVTQRRVGDDTKSIASSFPRTWKYLVENDVQFSKRKSSIYRNRPLFSIFGVGEYSFAPWKIAISGLYKSILFQLIGPFNGKPVVFDDTCYFIPFKTEEEAMIIKELLDTNICNEILESIIFWDSKRPITQEILNVINLPAIAKVVGKEDKFRKVFNHIASVHQSMLF